MTNTTEPVLASMLDENKDRLDLLTAELDEHNTALADMKASLSNSRERITYLKAELEKHQDNIARLAGNRWGQDCGQIVDKRKQIENTTRQIEDFGRPVVYWDTYRGIKREGAEQVFPLVYGEPIENCWVVTRVTPKRIYVRPIGGREIFVNLDGVADPPTLAIDMARTFPNGLPKK